MDTLDNELNVQAETRQMQTLQLYQKLVIFTLFKYKWSILAVLMLTIIAGIAVRYVQFKNSSHKYEGSVTLFYTPRASEEVKPLSINHVLGVFGRQQIFHQLIKELHLTEKQQSLLKQSIEVKLLKDQNDNKSYFSIKKTTVLMITMIKPPLAISLLRLRIPYRPASK